MKMINIPMHILINYYKGMIVESSDGGIFLEVLNF